MAEIIEFPKVKVSGPAQSKEELAQVLRDYKEEIAEEVSEFLWRHVLGELARVGCNFDKNIEVYFPSMVLVLESIRSLHLEANGIHHPLQDMAKDVIDVEEFVKSEKVVDISDELD